MALFGRQRDISLFRHVNRELIWDIITQQIGYYKVILEETYTNIYGEAMEKFLTDPVLLNCLITGLLWVGVDLCWHIAFLTAVSFVRTQQIPF